MKYVKYGFSLSIFLAAIQMMNNPMYTISESLIGFGIAIASLFVPVHWYQIAWEWIKNTAKRIADNRKNKELSIKLTNGMITRTVRKDREGYYYVSNVPDENAPRYTFEHIEYGGSTKYEHTGRKRLGVANRIKQANRTPITRNKRTMYDNAGFTKMTEEVKGKSKVYLRNVQTDDLKTINFKANDAEIGNVKRFFNTQY